MLLDLANELVGLFLRHLPATYHILNEITRTFDDEPAQAGGGVDDILHRCSHFTTSLEADFMRLCRHLGDSILDVGAAVAGTSFWGRRWTTLSRGGGHRRFVALSHHTLLIYFRSA
jgi:hypothetical protein